MRAPVILLLLAFGLAPMQARAAAHGGGGEAKEESGANYVDISPVGLPVIYQGRLINYVFVRVRLNLASSANAANLRAKEPYFRDALVKAAYRSPFTRLDDFTALDETALRQAMTVEAARIAGAKAVTGVEVTEQTPKTRVGLPKPPQARTARAAAPAAH